MEEFDWNVQNECHLLESMMGHKPIGINKSFQMMLIYDKFVEKIEKDVLSQLIWSRLETMYNLEALDESESIPFPNDESDFELPDVDFAELKELKSEEKKNGNVQKEKEKETPKNTKEIKKDDKTPNRTTKEVQRRDSKDSKNSIVKKEPKREVEKQSKPIKGRTISTSSKEDVPKSKNKNEDSARAVKRPTRGSLKPEDANSSGKASPVTVGSGSANKRRRI